MYDSHFMVDNKKTPGVKYDSELVQISLNP